MVSDQIRNNHINNNAESRKAYKFESYLFFAGSKTEIKLRVYGKKDYGDERHGSLDDVMHADPHEYAVRVYGAIRKAIGNHLA